MKIDQKDLQELKRYIELSNEDESKEALTQILSLYNYGDYMSQDLYNYIINELILSLNWFRENTKIVNRKIQQEYIIEDLEYLNE